MDTLVKEKIVNFYEEPFQFLEDIQVDYPKSTGTFKLNGKQYTKTVRPGLSGTNSIILITQAVLSSLCSNDIHKRIPELKDIDLPVEKAFEFAEHMMISRYHELAFKRPIMRDQDAPLTFSISLDKVIHKPSLGLTFFKMSYEICDHSFTGSLTATYNGNR